MIHEAARGEVFNDISAKVFDAYVSILPEQGRDLHTVDRADPSGFDDAEQFRNEELEMRPELVII